GKACAHRVHGDGGGATVAAVQAGGDRLGCRTRAAGGRGDRPRTAAAGGAPASSPRPEPGSGQRPEPRWTAGRPGPARHRRTATTGTRAEGVLMTTVGQILDAGPGNPLAAVAQHLGSADAGLRDSGIAVEAPYLDGLRAISIGDVLRHCW